MNVEGGKRSNSWHGPGISSLRCPYPECGHMAQIITKAHCRINHDMEREEIAEKYGYPVTVKMRPAFKGER
ncbi:MULTISPECIES: hypothetical protein [unclassified Sporosarcina]|uniref:hypothetical protein n=1 Tax=unclassified Sporosarcina TaxID=2647733 RepID=UPI00203EB3A9|nr:MULTISPECIES: hypothetical protein [unclassified Sporosarcina]GKV66730.1 hypothetical protein NCCP2331_28830 [Sporosarcina sp. NCCP-2331]GLB57087.1 hypothetical protein NCCP2378_28740 [Sporosarcina sp. NCCP-2378]